MVTEEQVLTVLNECYDPEIPVNIVDLGLIYGVHISPHLDGSPAEADPKQNVVVDMTMTSPGCPSHVQISEDVKRKIEGLPGIQSASVNIVWEPAWGPERLSAAAREKLGIEG